ncbi:MAG: multicopper oxidase domain-containing protein [Bacteroidota bacterium]|nr:multicopper oxidase domain-containing protein [Bacteroidota bacterium]MDP4228785.1 multicopper oxidase domain-containing protein [Bacteroidota bacterium]MDP4236897.1 multicopper oxidase domain-containing protein [Bacteroidota bacterium]
MKRRSFLKSIAGAGAFAALSTRLQPLLAKPVAVQSPLALNPLRIPQVITGGKLSVAQTTFKIFPDTDATVFSINNSIPGPTIKLKKGDTFTAKITNNLAEETVIHWHGLHVRAAMDGHPKNAIAPGSSFDVNYPIIQRAGTFFYHSHANMKTARQTYLGMSGCFIIEDDEELALGLPSGEFDIPLLIQDKRFDSGKQLEYDPKDSDMLGGWLGDTILVNGTPNAFLTVAQTMYRFRLINGSNARVYKIALAGGGSFTIIGNDGGLLEKPVVASSAMLAPAERLDIVIDFSSQPFGTAFSLQSLAFSFGGSAGSGSVPQGAALDLLQFQIDRTGTPGNPLPSVLSTITKYDIADSVRTRTYELNSSISGHYINFKNYDLNTIDQHVKFGDLEQWSFINESEQIHPMHVHGTQFQVLDRDGSPPEAYEMGWKDVIRLDSSGRVNVLVRFAEYTGVYLVHCHNLEHEDMGMMANFQVESTGGVSEEEAALGALTITPNPASVRATLSFPPLARESLLQITDDKGALQFSTMLPPEFESYELVTSHFAAGSYFVSIGGRRAKLVIVH